MNQSFMDALRMLKAQGGMSARPMMPNTPRDPAKDKADQEGFLQGQTGADYGQDPFAEPLPDPMQMAKLSGAMRLPPVMKAEPMSPKDFPEGSEMNDDYETTMARFKNPPAPTDEDEVVRVSPSSYFGEGKEGPKQPGQVEPNFDDYGDAGASEDLFDDPFAGVGTQPESISGSADFTQVAPGMGMGLPELERQEVGPMAAVGRPPEDPRMMLQEYMKRLQGGNPAEAQKDQSLATMLQGNEQANSKLGLMQLMLASANKMGSVGGKIASNDDAAAYFGGMQKQNDRSGQMIAGSRMQEKKTADEKLKAMMFMAKQKQDEEKYQNDLDFRGKQLEALTGYQDKKLGVDERRNELDSAYKDMNLKAIMGNNESKLEVARMRTEIDKNKNDKSLGLQEKNIDSQIENRKVLAKVAQQNADSAKAKREADAKKALNNHSKISQGAAKTEMFRSRMENADKAFDTLSKKPGYDPTSTKDALAGSIPFVGNSLVSKEKQLQEQYQQEFVQATLRDESGATIGTDEYNKNMKKYFPVWGDSKETIARKAATRKADIKTLMDSYKAQKGDADAAIAGYEDRAPAGNSGASGSWDNAPVMDARDL